MATGEVGPLMEVVPLLVEVELKLELGLVITLLQHTTEIHVVVLQNSLKFVQKLIVLVSLFFSKNR